MRDPCRRGAQYLQLAVGMVKTNRDKPLDLGTPYVQTHPYNTVYVVAPKMTYSMDCVCLPFFKR